MEKRDYYAVLGVTRTSSKIEIKKAYRKIAFENHPDRNPGDKAAEEKFREAASAYEVLCDDQKRATYDRFGHAGLDGHSSGFSDVNDIFSSFGSIFEDFFGGGFSRQRGPEKGDDLRYDMRLSFKETVFGCQKEIVYERAGVCSHCEGQKSEPGKGGMATCSTCGGVGQVRRSQGFFTVQTVCPTCQGSGQSIEFPCTQCRGVGLKVEKKKLSVQVPAGVDSGMKLRMEGEGSVSADPRAAQDAARTYAGDLYIFIDVKADPRFERDGTTILCKEKVRYDQLVLGDKIEVETFDGPVMVKVPAGSQIGDQQRIRGHGLPSLRTGKRGDFVVCFELDVPKKVSNQELKAVQALRDAFVGK